jgi:hypothetical protein
VDIGPQLGRENAGDLNYELGNKIYSVLYINNAVL